ncbi:PAS fold [Plasmopara halstedii]|uniref:PAS fold n=1 Tax=Plasmopara halstedii TaxID=4781 RepID=A0A0P1ALV6_PLAHL|nr:PAS fold [Plasmopara halstedii]CEG42162.1 PAS fold [Plasmopara halstedii]|eukprot:XP_024578531.1 PAS fold [Plasmopara halstedii]
MQYRVTLSSCRPLTDACKRSASNMATMRREPTLSRSIYKNFKGSFTYRFSQKKESSTSLTEILFSVKTRVGVSSLSAVAFIMCLPISHLASNRTILSTPSQVFMLPDYGYTPSPASSIHYQTQHVASGERSKLFLHPPSVEYGHMPQHTLTPQHATCTKFETEPLVMNVHGVQHYYPLPHGHSQLLHVSSDYEYQNGAVVTPSSTRSGSKRSREDLNLKEKKRMLKLNDRISQLKNMLDDAGVQTKKNKQSILDNAAHYIEMLRSNLLIAKQKAERAEKQAEAFRLQAQHSSCDRIVRGVFQKTTTPRVVVDLHMQTVTFNAAFVHYTGQTESELQRQKSLRSYLSADEQQLDRILAHVRTTKQSTSAQVQVAARDGNLVPMNLVAAVITDESGNATNVEFSLIPLETQKQELRTKEQHEDEAETSADESVTDKDDVSREH